MRPPEDATLRLTWEWLDAILRERGEEAMEVLLARLPLINGAPHRHSGWDAGKLFQVYKRLGRLRELADALNEMAGFPREGVQLIEEVKEMERETALILHPSSPTDLMKRLRETCSELFQNQLKIRMICQDIELPVERININQATELCWLEVINEAHHQRCITRLVDRLLEDYTGHPTLIGLRTSIPQCGLT